MQRKTKRLARLNREWVQDLHRKLEAIQRNNTLGPTDGMAVERTLEDLKFMIGPLT